MPSIDVTDDLDPRLTPAREDLAASWLKSHVRADRYVEPSREHVMKGVVNLYRSPDDRQAIETQLLYGEHVDVYEKKDGWAWIQSVRDGYVGYTRSDALGIGKGDTTATHRIANVGSFIFPGTSGKASPLKIGGTVTPGTGYKTTPLLTLSYGSLVRVAHERDVLSELVTGELVPTSHLAAVDFHAEDPVAEAFRFLGVPYLWGGRSHLGIDCSALIQLVLQACNISCPRDSDLQEKMLGHKIERDAVRSGDLVFFRGHLGLMIDENTLIHASDRAMAVSIDDLDEYINWRAKAGKSPVKMFKRL